MCKSGRKRSTHRLRQQGSAETHSTHADSALAPTATLYFPALQLVFKVGGGGGRVSHREAPTMMVTRALCIYLVHAVARFEVEKVPAGQMHGQSRLMFDAPDGLWVAAQVMPVPILV